MKRDHTDPHIDDGNRNTKTFIDGGRIDDGNNRANFAQSSGNNATQTAATVK